MFHWKAEAPTYTAQAPSSDEIETMADAVVSVRKQRFPEDITSKPNYPLLQLKQDMDKAIADRNLPPLPPKAKPRIRALSLPPEPDKSIVVQWDAKPDPMMSYRLEWSYLNFSWPLGVFDTPVTKVDVVALFKQKNVPPGWYRINVAAVNEELLSSAPVAATTLFWWPRQ
jgi:hypothetical protein